MATNKVDELTLMCEELKPNLLIVTKHAFNKRNINQFKILNYQLANSHCRTSAKGGGTAIFSRNNFSYTPYKLTEATDKDFEVTGVKIQTN